MIQNFLQEDCDSDVKVNLSHISRRNKSKNHRIEPEMPDIGIHKYDLNDLPNNSKTLIIGKRENGKSWLTIDIINHVNNKTRIDKCIIFNPTEKLKKFYADKINPKCVHFDLNEDIINNIVENQINTNGAEHILVVLDDCLFKKPSDIMSNLLLNSQNLNITLVLTLQYSLKINPTIRSGFDQIFLFREDVTGNKKRLFEHYGGVFPNPGTFYEIFDKCVPNYGTLTLTQNNRQNNDFFDIVKNYRAKIVDNFLEISEIEEEILFKTQRIENVTADTLVNIANCNLDILDIIKSDEKINDTTKQKLHNIISKCNNIIVK
jgi:hypothetical protein